ncbi:MAG: hypothetical protein KatS3mg131_1197 [Candidatus Tectimicrobiota bacterium]|nr:MAG: hypothetical protein KatS3mg131_1197 [Candidatus Tectomicrobia bacterium]
MQHNVEWKEIPPQRLPQLQEVFSRHVQALAEQVADFPPDAVYLHAVVAQHPQRPLARVGLTLHLPKRVLSAREERDDVETALHEAFAELERQLAKHKAFLRQEHLWRRPARRQALRERLKLESVPLAERERALLNVLIQQHLHKLYNFARREIAVLQATGDLLPGDLTPEEVVDAVVLRAARELHTRPPRLEGDRWLLRLAVEVLRSEVRRRRAERAAALHLEQPAPPDSQTSDDEIYAFYQPDEKLRLEDLVPDPYMPTPEEVVASRDLQRYLNQTLAMLPATWRQAFVLHDIEGCTVAETAHILDVSEEEVRQALDHAHAFLRQKLAEAELQPAPGRTITAEQFFASTAQVEVPEAYRTALEDRLRPSSEAG